MNETHSIFRKRTDEQKAAQRKAEKKAETDRRVAELREKMNAGKERRRADEQRRKAEEIDALEALLQDGETLDGMFRTNDLVMKKHVLVTSQRLIVGLDAGHAESIFYGHIAGLQTTNFLGDKDLIVAVAGRKEKVELHFKNADDRDQLRDLISARLVAK